MEKNKRTKNSILLWFIGSLFLSLILISIILLKLKPDIEEIESMKLDLKTDYDYFISTSTKWISFNDFKSVVNWNHDIKKDLYITSVVNSIDEDFYSKNLTNNTQSSFDDYISKKQKDLSPREVKVYWKEEKINKVLPIYTDDARFLSKWVMKDFYLVNNIESLFKTFELSYWNKISINNISPVPWFESSKISEPLNPDSQENNDWVSNESLPKAKITDWIQSDIFFIPMTINISWTKYDLQNFLHYLENVWSFNVVWNDIKFYNDDFIKNKSWEKVVLYNDDFKDIKDYNIYNNQLVNITSVKFDDKFIDNNVSWSEVIALDVDVEFFVKWIPHYKMQEFVNKFLANYNDFSNLVNKKLIAIKNSNIPDDKLREEKFLKVKNYLSTMDSEVKLISTDLWNIDNLESIYKKSLEYNNNLLNIQKLFTQI